MAYWQYSQHSRLKAVDERALKTIRPVCLECGQRLLRLALRESFEPWAWIPFGWICSACSAVFAELK